LLLLLLCVVGKLRLRHRLLRSRRHCWRRREEKKRRACEVSGWARKSVF
jgi:hypothetical protein